MPGWKSICRYLGVLGQCFRLSKGNSSVEMDPAIHSFTQRPPPQRTLVPFSMSSTSQFGGDSEATSTVGADKPLRPTIVLLPGAWHNSSIFGPLTSLLQEKHFPTVVVDLPTSGADPPVKDAIEDVITIRKVLDRVLEAGEQVSRTLSTPPKLNITQG